MISVEEAQLLVKKHLPDFGITNASVVDVRGEVLGEDLIADRDYPPFHRVMMDGIAVNFNVFREGKCQFTVSGTCPAGSPAQRLTDSGACLEVMTGAPLPEGADLVIPYEHLKIENNIATITEDQERSPMENVHLMGSDAKKGETLLSRGQLLNGPHWGIAASLGYGSVKIRRKPRVNVISTGDELVDVHESPLAHQIRKSNAHALKASLRQQGFEHVELSHLADEISAIESHYKKASEEFDLLIYSGGVSKGKYDYLPETWKKMGATEIFHGITQRPGKPMWFGVDAQKNTVILGLPGNPVSSLVCLHRYFLHSKEIYAELTQEISFKKDLTYFVPVKIEYTRTGTMKAHPLKIKNSGEFSALAESDGFLELPREQTLFPKGEAYRFYSWRQV